MYRILPTDQIPTQLPLFAGIPAQKVPHVLGCLQARLVRFDAGSVVRSPGVTTDFVAYLLNGAADAVVYDEQGNKSILHGYTPGQVISCGRVFDVQCPPCFGVYARDDCDLLCFNPASPKVSCEHCARYVNVVKGNLVQSMVSLNNEFLVTLDIRRRRTSRGKLVAYLEDQARRAGSTSFDIPYNRQELADYLCVDRAALSRELSRLRDEGQLDYEKNHFDLHLAAPKCRAAAS